ncbi:serine/threonine-protein kinase [Streptomyces sp. CAI-17]|uniref:serine/threonine-protein kinase n=1 Tax=Streptomyces sp. CAI-17 TaxID=1169742 RepID=UPI001595B94B|nr:serine/threonine protein kinase [Streptomyces sp. CAI-17]
MPGYKKLEEIGSGGQATVHLGEDVDTGEKVALKYLTPAGKKINSAEVQEDRIRFLREVREQSRLEHTNIVPVLAFSGRGQRPWYAMPLANGSLENYLESDKRDASWSVSVMHKVVDAMEYAHNEGVVHRDLKPSNLLLIKGEWKVSDFGFCRNLNSDSNQITRPASIFGTTFYAAPEQYDDAHAVGPTADVYAIGRILIHCLTWHRPPPGVNRLNELPPEFREVVVHCVAEYPHQRFQTMTELRAALNSIPMNT